MKRDSLVNKLRSKAGELLGSTLVAAAKFADEVNDFNLKYNTGGFDLFKNSTNMLPAMVAEAVAVGGIAGLAVYYIKQYIKTK